MDTRNEKRVEEISNIVNLETIDVKNLHLNVRISFASFCHCVVLENSHTNPQRVIGN